MSDVQPFRYSEPDRANLKRDLRDLLGMGLHDAERVLVADEIRTQLLLAEDLDAVRAVVIRLADYLLPPDFRPQLNAARRYVERGP